MSEENSSPEDISCDESSDEYVPDSNSSSDNCDEPLPKRRKQGETSTDAVIPTIRKSHDCVEPMSERLLPLEKVSSTTNFQRLSSNVIVTEEARYSAANDAQVVDDLSERKLSVDSKGRRNCCFYCGKYLTRISRHMLTHGSEKEIIDIFAIKDEKKRAHYLKGLKLKGNYRHNTECLEKGEGKLLVMRSPKSLNDATKYLPCSYCYGFVAKRELFKHCKTCPFRQKEFVVSNPISQGKLLLLPHLKCSSSDELESDVLCKMRDDEIKSRIKRDPLILAVGNTLVHKLRASHGEKSAYLSHRLRNLGKLLIESENIKGHAIPLMELVKPVNFDLVITCVKNLCQGKGKPKSLGLRLGHSIRKCCEVARCLSIKSGNVAQKQEVENFLVLMDREWSDMISSSLLREIYDDKLTKETILPVTSDLVQLTTHVNTSLQRAIETMKSTPTEENFFNLSKITLCKLIIFNKRRGGEVSRITVRDFIDRSGWQSSKNEDIFASLSNLEKKLSERLALIKVRGKRGRHVPILLTPEAVQAMDLLVQDRKNIGFIKQENHYFFANKGSKYFRGCDVLHEIIARVELKNPSAITSTNLRKYVATVTQIISLEKEELEWVADHLGHDIEVHREFYRLQESTLEVSKVSKLLLAIDNGCVHELAGKKLSDITMDHCFPNRIEVPVSQTNEVNEIESHDEPVGKENENVMNIENTRKTKDKVIPLQLENLSQGRKRSWDIESRGKALKYFRLFIENKRVPGKAECEKFLKKYNVKDRTWKDVKYLIHNNLKR